MTSDRSAPAPTVAVQRKLRAARTHCATRGAQLTAQRAEVLELLLLRGGQAKAYDLQDDMQARHGRIAPTTVYRALEFLQAHHLAENRPGLRAAGHRGQGPVRRLPRGVSCFRFTILSIAVDAVSVRSEARFFLK